MPGVRVPRRATRPIGANNRYSVKPYYRFVGPGTCFDLKDDMFSSGMSFAGDLQLDMHVTILEDPAIYLIVVTASFYFTVVLIINSVSSSKWGSYTANLLSRYRIPLDPSPV
jgi:hypothetical protein